MKAFIGLLSLEVAVLMLTACAPRRADQGASSVVQPTPTRTSPSAATTARRDPRVPYNYRMVTKGDQVLYCRKEALNGSRAQVVETCLTAEEIQAQEQKAAALQRDMDDSWEKKPVMDNMAGRSNGDQVQ